MLEIDDLNINLSMNRISKYYPNHCLPSKLKNRNGKAEKCGFEEIFHNLYDAKARMVAFHTSLNRLLLWVKALEILYYDNLGKILNLMLFGKMYLTDGRIETVQRTPSQHRVHRATDAAVNSLMYKFKFFITTGTIQAQGNQVEIFDKEHFPVMNSLYHR